MTTRKSRVHVEPRGLSKQESSDYIGVGQAKFDEMVNDGRMPPAKRIDGRLVWDRYELDAAFDRLPNRGQAGWTKRDAHV